MKIDLVYCYVNGNDESWIRKRNSYASNPLNPENRYRDNSELKYSLRSVEKNVSWIHRIYIVVDSESQIPGWLDLSNPKIRIITHRDIIPERYLPCFNSNVIESYLYRIPGLSDIFLYANDDMFFGNAISENFFVSAGKPIVRLIESKKEPEGYYEGVLHNAQRLIHERYGVWFPLIPTHTLDVYSKNAMEECFHAFSNEFDTVSKNRFREENDINRVIFSYYLIVHDQGALKAYKQRTFWDKVKMMLFPEKYLDYAMSHLNDFFSSKKNQWLFARKPKLACLNDGDYTTAEDLIKYHHYMEKMFPEKSCFEK